MDDTIAEVARGLQDMVRVPCSPLSSLCACCIAPRLHALQLTLQGGGSCGGGGGGAYSGKGVSCAGGGLR